MFGEHITYYVILFADGRIPLDKTITVTEYVKISMWLIILTSCLSTLGIALAVFLLGFNLRYRKKKLVSNHPCFSN